MAAILDRIAERLEFREDGCWVWPGAHTPPGYGQIRQQGKTLYVHRVVWEEAVGPIPEGYHIDHLCRNPPCANPDHLEPVTERENILRGVGPAARAARQTHCSRGHPFDEANTRRIPSRPTYRYCRTCDSERG